MTLKKKIPYRKSTQHKLRFDDQVVLVTGGGRGIGRSLAIMYARRGARVVVNDTGCSVTGEGGSHYHADSVVWKILSFGGVAIANYSCVSDARSIVNFTLLHFGRIDVLVCNAGIIEKTRIDDLQFNKWDLCMSVHLFAVRDLVLACWPHFCKNGYGRIAVAVDHAANTGSAYCASKMAVLGFVRSLSRHIDLQDIHLNAFSPLAITRTNYKEYNHLNEEAQYIYHPKRVAPLVAYLTHSQCTESGSLFKVGVSQHYKMELYDTIAFDIAKLVPDSFTAHQNDLSMRGLVAFVSGGSLGKRISQLLITLGAQISISYHEKIDILINCCDQTEKSWISTSRANIGKTYSLFHNAWPSLNPGARIVNIAPLTLDTPAKETLEWALYGMSLALNKEGKEIRISANTLTGIIDDEPHSLAIWAACLLAHPNTNCNGVFMNVCDQRLSLLNLRQSMGLDLSNSTLPAWHYPEVIKKDWPNLISFEDHITATGSLSDLIPRISPYPSPHPMYD